MEPAIATQARAAILTTLQRAPEWSLPVPDLPVLAGLGCFGIDRGIVIESGELLEGTDWVAAVNGLSADERATCLQVDPAIAVSVLHAAAAGVRVLPAGSSPHTLIPLGFSAAVNPDAPLAPVGGAAEFDSALFTALRTNDVEGLRKVIAEAARVHAQTTLLQATLSAPLVASGAIASTLGRDLPAVAATTLTATPESTRQLEIVFDAHVHEVRTLVAIGNRT